MLGATLESDAEFKARVRRDSVTSSVETEEGQSKLANQFAFIERATQTMNNGSMCAEIQTDPPPR